MGIGKGRFISTHLSRSITIWFVLVSRFDNSVYLIVNFWSHGITLWNKNNHHKILFVVGMLRAMILECVTLGKAIDYTIYFSNTYFNKFGSIQLQGLIHTEVFCKSLNIYYIKSRKIISKNYSIKFGRINQVNYFLN